MRQWNGHLDIFSRLQAIEKSRQFLLSKQSLGALRQDKARKARLSKIIDDNVELPKASTVVIFFLLWGLMTVVKIGNRPLALRGHVTNASFKQRVGILPKIVRAHKNYLIPEI